MEEHAADEFRPYFGEHYDPRMDFDEDDYDTAFEPVLTLPNGQRLVLQKPGRSLRDRVLLVLENPLAP